MREGKLNGKATEFFKPSEKYIKERIEVQKERNAKFIYAEMKKKNFLAAFRMRKLSLSDPEPNKDVGKML